MFKELYNRFLQFDTSNTYIITAVLLKENVEFISCEKRKKIVQLEIISSCRNYKLSFPLAANIEARGSYKIEMQSFLVGNQALDST